MSNMEHVKDTLCGDVSFTQMIINGKSHAAKIVNIIYELRSDRTLLNVKLFSKSYINTFSISSDKQIFI